MDPVSFPLAAVTLRGEEVAGDQSGRFVLEREHPARAAGESTVQPGQLVLGELGTVVLAGLAVIPGIAGAGAIAAVARARRIRRVRVVAGTVRIGGAARILGVVERRVVVPERLVVVLRATRTLVIRFARLARTHGQMLSDEVREERTEALGNVADRASQ
jgi:hypothetical protein